MLHQCVPAVPALSVFKVKEIYFIFGFSEFFISAESLILKICYLEYLQYLQKIK